MQWHTLANALLAALARRVVPALTGAIVLLLVDVGLLDAQIGRNVDHLFRPSALSLTQADTVQHRWAATRW